MSQKEFLSRLGFSSNPFQHTNADEEEHLQSYFIPPPYFSSVWGDPTFPQSHVIFAPRGAGKSAQRRMIEYDAERNNVFAITYDRFENLTGTDLRKVGIDYHLGNIIQLGLLGFLLEYHTRGMQAPAFKKVEREQIEILCHHYLGKITRLEALGALDSLRTLSSKAKQFLQDWSGPLNTLITAAMSTQGFGQGKLESGHARREVVESPKKIHLEIVRDLIKSIGFKSIYVLIDKVDETPETGNNAEASFLLIRPMLRDLDLLQIKGIGFKFFLWDNLERYYRQYARPDRLQQFELSWTETEINKMLSRRLEAFSNGRVTDLSQLTDAQLAAPLQFTVVLFACGSPRDMVRICQQIMSEELQQDPESTKIGIEAIIQGISKFATTRAQELCPDVLPDLIKVGRLSFTNNFVANDVFKITVNSARNKTRQWIKNGAVEKIGELHSGGRPIYQYAVRDIRVARAMLPHLDFVEFLQRKTHLCERCQALLLRDWDMQPTQPCPTCGTESTYPIEHE